MKAKHPSYYLISNAPPKKKEKEKNSKRAKSYSDTGPVDNSLHPSLGSSCQPQGSHFIRSALILSLHWDGTSVFTSKAQWGAASCQCGRRKKQWDAQMHSIEKPRDASQNIPSSRALLWKTHRRADYWWCTCCGKKQSGAHTWYTTQKATRIVQWDGKVQEHRLLGLEETGVHYWVYFMLVLQTWGCHFSSLGLRWLICKIEIRVASIP